VPILLEVVAEVSFAVPDTVILPVELLYTAAFPVAETVPPETLILPDEALYTALPPLPVFSTVPPEISSRWLVLSVAGAAKRIVPPVVNEFAELTNAACDTVILPMLALYIAMP